MRININNQSTFQSLRLDRSFVKQLTVESGYSLAENNQKNILKAIKNLSESGTVSSARFLIETARDLKYSTNIPFNIAPKNRWKAVLMLAASACAVKAGLGNSKKINKQYKEVFYNQELNEDEKEILASYDSILARMNGFKPDKNAYEAVKNNLEYFIMSSETSIGDKKYILERLDYFLSDDYKINKQLEDKKFQAFSEIINDLALDKVNNDIPNIKASNQNTHGMCTVFSITRKLLAYEYKRNYTDFIMQELDDSDEIMVYDRNNLGKGRKIPVKKAVINYNGMIERGFRIVDAAAANWMNIADINSATSNVEMIYVPYDSASFGVYNDSHLKFLNPDTKISGEHNYITALMVTEDKLKRVKSAVIKQKLNTNKNSIDYQLKQAEYSRLLQENLGRILSERLDDDYKEMAHDIIVGLMSLRKRDSKDVDSTKTVAHEYLYIDNEEKGVKQNKIKSYLNDGFGYAFKQAVDDETANEIYALLEDITAINNKSNVPSRYKMAKLLIEAVSACRNQLIISCTLPERLHNHLIMLEVPDEDTVFLDNIDGLKAKVNAGDKFIIESLSQNLEIEPSKEEVLNFLDSCAEYIKNLPAVYDDLYKRMNLDGRKEVLIKELQTMLDILNSDDTNKKRDIISLTGIYDEEELRLRANKALDLLTYRELIDKYSHIFDCESDKDEVLAHIKVQLGELASNHDEEKVNKLADMLEVQPDEIMETLITSGEILTGAMDNVYYAEASKLINQKSIKNDFMSYYNNLVKILSNGTDVEFVKKLLINNGLEPEITQENISLLPQRILGAINEMADTVNTIAQRLFIEKDGDIVNSVVSSHIVLDYYEKVGVLTKASVIDRFNAKFEALYKLQAQKHNYTDKEYKQKRKELTKFTRAEKEELNKILGAVNLMYKITRKEKDMIFRCVRPDYEEIFREYGVNNGKYWVSIMPFPGLSSEKEVALLESVTDKPYFIQKDLKKAFKDIKNGKFSGITGSSVSDTRIGLHAQYIASIDTLKVPSKSDPKKMVEKDVLFHDNSWGIREKDNTWTDSKGLTRTDYNNDFGYKYGYITNDKYRNGTFVDDLLYKSGLSVAQSYNNKQLKKLNPYSSYTFELMEDVIMPGTSPKALSVAKSIRDLLLIPDSYNLGLLEEFAEKMSPEELKHRIKVLNKMEMQCRSVYNKLEKRIKGNRFNSGIKTEADYKALADDDVLKIMLERAALRKMFLESIYSEKIEEVLPGGSLENLKRKMFNEARNKFGYTFLKDINIVQYISSDKNTKELFDEVINPALSAAGIDYDEQIVSKELRNDKLISKIKNNGYDGSLRSLAKAFSNVYTNGLIDKFGNRISVQTAQEIRDGIYKHIISMYALKPEEINKDTLPENVINWIDKTYNPETNEKFVLIFNRIQNYTLDEYNRLVASQLTDDDLVENITGYDLVRSINANRETAEDALLNEIFIDEFTGSFDLSKTAPYTRYNRFSKKITGAVYKRRKFDDVYLGLRANLKSLTYDRMFGKVKEMNYKQYGVLPSYPRIEFGESDEELTKTSLGLVKSANSRISVLRQQMQVFDSADWIVNFVREHADKTLTYSEVYYLRKQVESIILNTSANKEFSEVSAALSKMLTSGDSIELESYIPVVDQLEKICNSLLRLCSRQKYQEKLDSAEKDLNDSIGVYLTMKILPEYRDRVRGKMKEWLAALNRRKPSAADKYQEVLDMTEKYYMLNNPEKLLQEYLYLISSGNNESNRQLVASMKNSLDSLLITAKYIGIQDTIMKATRFGITNVVANEFDNIDIALYEKGANGKKSRKMYKMSSPEVLCKMIRPLLMEDNFEAAKSFIQKFNLVEKVVPALMEMPEITGVDNYLKSLEKIQAQAKAEERVIKDLKAKIQNIPSNTAQSEIKNISRDYIKELKENAGEDNIYIDDLITTFGNVINSDVVDTLEGLTVSVFLYNVVQTSLGISSKSLADTIEEINSAFYNAKIVMDLIDKLILPDGNEGLLRRVNNFKAWYTKTMDKQNECIDVLNALDIL